MNPLNFIDLPDLLDKKPIVEGDTHPYQKDWSEQTLHDHLQMFFYSRTEYFNPKNTSQDWRRAFQQVKERMKALDQPLTAEERKEALQALDEAFTEAYAISENLYYRKGFSDGVQFLMAVLTGENRERAKKVLEQSQ